MKINGTEYQFIDDPEELIGKDYYRFNLDDVINPIKISDQLIGLKCASYKDWHLIVKPVK